METSSPSSLKDLLLKAKERYVRSNPESARMMQSMEKFMPGGNTRTTLFVEPFPVVIVGGQGNRITDLDGHEYQNFVSEYSVALYGHSEPKIHEVIVETLKSGINLNGPNKYEGLLAEEMCRRFPSCDLVRFTNSGTEANLLAILLARAFSKKSSVMAFRSCYHGSAFNFNDNGASMRAPFPWILGNFNDVEGALKLLIENERELAAVIVEPIVGRGAIPADIEFLRMLRSETKSRGILLIFDEVMSSRTSAGGRQEIVGITPDITTFGKYIGGGMTFGAFGGRRDLMDLFDPRRPDALQHGGTFNNNVLSMAAGYTGLTEIFTPEVAKSFNSRCERFRLVINDMAAASNLALHATGYGSMIGLHFQAKCPESPSEISTAPELRKLFQLEMMLRGYYMTPTGYIPLALGHSDEVLEDMLYVLTGFLNEFEMVLPKRHV